MAKITVDISDKMINETLKKHVKYIEKQIKRLKDSNQKLSNKIRSQNFKVQEAERIIVIASAIAAEFGDEWGDKCGT